MYTYILRCEDNSLYCGYTTDIERRESEHKSSIGSKYVRAHKFKKMEVYIKLETKSLAMKMERAIKKLTKNQKEDFIAGNDLVIEKLNIDYISVHRYV